VVEVVMGGDDWSTGNWGAALELSSPVLALLGERQRRLPVMTGGLLLQRRIVGNHGPYLSRLVPRIG
jgi:hypothetical protein